MLTIQVPRLNDAPADYLVLARLWNRLVAEGLRKRLYVTFDFSHCDFLRPGAVVFLGGLARLIALNGGQATFLEGTMKKRLKTYLQQSGLVRGITTISRNSIPYKEYNVQDKEEIIRSLKDDWLGRGWINVSSALANAIAGQVWFDVALGSQSEAIRVDYRRRLDEATAVHYVVKPIWIRQSEIAERQKELVKNKWRKVELVLLFGGAIISWWLSPDGKFDDNVGTWLMLFGAVTYALFLLEQHSLNSETKVLEQRQSEFFCRWLASGASVETFWSSRDLCLRENTGETAGEGSEDLAKRKSSLWLDLKRALFSSATGTYPPFVSSRGNLSSS